ncbi:hypothetical protein GUJ93_ZPchr0008g12518 [Zizania palustris]|uniref:Uncharacterized protein n=1 Tax=Zizania palustris TaxID=103762 RepID=A0A8J5RB92_ZIZPA|nr:hypothetical protein GUJ93_ZPchr0008g12518 [Zizania palustris]
MQWAAFWRHRKKEEQPLGGHILSLPYASCSLYSIFAFLPAGCFQGHLSLGHFSLGIKRCACLGINMPVLLAASITQHLLSDNVFHAICECDIIFHAKHTDIIVLNCL